MTRQDTDLLARVIRDTPMTVKSRENLAHELAEALVHRCDFDPRAFKRDCQIDLGLMSEAA